MKKLLNLALVLLSMLILACQKSEVIIEDISQKDANEIIVILRDQNINAQKITVKERKSNTYKIAVDIKQAQTALKLLVQNQIPRETSPGLRDVYPPGSSGIIPTKSDENARLMMALQGEIETLIKLLPGIIDVKVVLSMDSSPDYAQIKQPKSASVTTIYLKEKTHENKPVSNEDIKALISSSISGLSVEQVYVVQKQLVPIEYLGIASKKDIIVQPSTIKPDATDASRNLVWVSLLITALALLTGAYAMARLLWQKRSQQYLSTPLNDPNVEV